MNGLNTQELRELFALFDTDKDNRIDRLGLQYALKSLGIELQDTEIENITRKYPDTISFSDFEEISKKLYLQGDPDHDIHTAFSLFDENHTGTISVSNLRRIAREIVCSFIFIF